MEGMAVVESAENPGAWEQRRVQVALRIELAGLQLIGERGLDDTTVEQIAKEAGISVRTFFRYFRNARDILTAVPERESQRMCRALWCDPPARASSTGSTAGSTRWTSAATSPRRPASSNARRYQRWSVIVREAPDVLASESRVLTTLTAELGGVVRARLGFGADDDEKVGVLAAAFAAVIWYVFTRSLAAGDPDLPSRLDEAFRPARPSAQRQNRLS